MLTFVALQYTRKRLSWRLIMSRQLAISAAFSIFAMAAFVLFAPALEQSAPLQMQTGAKVQTLAPALDRSWPALFPFGT